MDSHYVRQIQQCHVCRATATTSAYDFPICDSCYNSIPVLFALANEREQKTQISLASAMFKPFFNRVEKGYDKYVREMEARGEKPDCMYTWMRMNEEDL